MAHQKSRSTTFRARAGFDEAVDAIAAELGLADRTETLHFIVFEKARSLGLREKAAAAADADPSPPEPSPPKAQPRKRR